MTTAVAPVPELVLARRALGAEWVKLRSVRSTTWTLLATLAVCVGLEWLIAAARVSRWSELGPGEKLFFDRAWFSYHAMFLGQLVIGSLGALVMTAEFTTGSIRATFAAVPRRGRVLAAKAAVFAAVALAVSEVISFSAFGIVQAVLHSKHAGASLSDPGMLRAVIGAGIYLTLVGLLGLAIGAILRSTAASIGTLVALMFVAPLLVQALPRSLAESISKYLPTEAGTAIMRTIQPPDTLGPWTGLGLLAAYCGIALLAAAVLLKRRDA